MEFLRAFRRRSFLSNSIYVLLNLLLAVALFFLVITLESPVPAFLLVILSKWRVLAVRPRYWLSNIQANLVDFTVGLGFVTLLYSLNQPLQQTFFLQIALTVLYAIWLIVLKPKSTKKSIVLQASVALVVGITALFSMSHLWPVSVVTLLTALIGYVTARHVLAQYDEDQLQLLSLMWALIIAELGWIAYHWTIAYTIPIVNFSIPQVVIVVMCVALIAYKVYDSYATHKRVRVNDVLIPTLFSISIIAVLLFLFNYVKTGII